MSIKENHSQSLSASKIRDAALTAAMTAVIAVCSWITVPYTVPFTMQTFAVFLSLRLLGGKRGFISVILFVLLGAAGLPVFSGFRAGLGVLAGPTGGYITGFIFAAGLYWIAEKRLDRIIKVYFALFAGLFICYLAGTLQFVAVMKASGTSYGFTGALAACVLPYIIPDAVKIILAVTVASRVAKAVKINE